MKRRHFLKAAAGAAGLGGLAKTLPSAWAGAAARGSEQRARLTVVMDEPTGMLNRNLLGQFAEFLGTCIYDGMWVGPDSSIPNTHGLRNDTLQALKRIHAPIMRWPGGCYAESYHWRDGIGPRSRRPRNWNLFWGREESNAFGTDEFMEYCHLTGISPYLCLNIGSGSVQEAIDWMEYCNGDYSTTLTRERAANGHPAPYNVKYWSLGNEDWGCGGRYTPEGYADRYVNFVAYLENAAHGHKVEFVACGWEEGDWNRKFFAELPRKPGVRRISRFVQQLSIHHYMNTGKDMDFTEKEYYDLLAAISGLERVLRRTIGVIDEFTEPEGGAIGVALDEWGVYHPTPSRGPHAWLQPVTFRDSLAAAVSLHSMHSFGSRVSMACISQAFNAIQSMAFTRGPRMVLTPTYYVFDLMTPHMDATGLRSIVDSPTFEGEVKTPEDSILPSKISRPCLSASASRDAAGKKLCITLVNQHLTEDLEVDIDLAAGAAAAGGTLRELTARDVHDQNTFENPHAVKAPSEKLVKIAGRKFTLRIPAHSVQALSLDLA